MDQGLGDNDFSAVAEAYRKNKWSQRASLDWQNDEIRCLTAALYPFVDRLNSVLSSGLIIVSFPLCDTATSWLQNS
jgi:hypothetical protein